MSCARWYDCYPWNIWIAGNVKRPLLFYGIFFLVTAYGMPVAVPVAGNTSESKTGSETSPSLLLQEAFIEDAREAIDLLYNREYDASIIKLSIWQERHPEHPVWMFWESLEAWWPVLVDLENTSYDEDYLAVSLNLIDYCDKILRQNSEDLDALIVRSAASGQVARFYSNRGRWYRSFRYARSALKDFFKVEESYPEIPDLNFGIGMYRYFSAFLIEEYTLARRLRWMLPSGDREEGLSRLQLAADSSIFVEPEATYFLGHIYLHYERKPDQALNYLRELYNKYPDNTYYRRLYIRSLYELDHQQEALTRIAQSLAHQEYSRRHEMSVMMEDLYTIRGQIYKQNNEYDLAQADFLESVKISEHLHPFGNRSNLIISLYYLGENSLRNDDRNNARYFFSRAATAESDHPLVSKSRDMLKSNHLE